MDRRRFLKTTTAAAVAATGLVPAFVREVGAAAPVKVGVMLPLSKVMASLGESTLSGVQFGHKELGAEVSGRPVQLITEDDSADPSLGLSKVRKLVEKDGDKEVIVDEKKAPAQTCTDEQRAKVKDIITAYVKAGPALASNEAPPVTTGAAAAATPAPDTKKK